MDANKFFNDLPMDFRKFLDETGQTPVHIPEPITPARLMEFRAEADPDELIPKRFLCRGGSLLLAAPTGIGKSSFAVQFAVHAACAREFFGIHFVRPLKIATIQAENDEGDLAEAFQGVMRAFAEGPHGLEKMNEEEMANIGKGLRFYRESTRSGAAFAALLRELVRRDRPDIAIVDPAFAFLGADASSQKEVSAWLRNLINPILMETGVAVAILHHSNKPLRGVKDNWQGSDFAYLGAGSAEWANWARAILGFQQTIIPGIFSLIAGKRGSRLGWTDKEGKPQLERHIAHSKEPGRIYWREPRIEETREIGRQIAADGFHRLADVFLTETEQNSGLPADEIMRRAQARGITTSKNLRQIKSQWITGPHPKAMDGGILEKINENYRPKNAGRIDF